MKNQSEVISIQNSLNSYQINKENLNLLNKHNSVANVN